MTLCAALQDKKFCNGLQPTPISNGLQPKSEWPPTKSDDQNSSDGCRTRNCNCS